MNKNINSSNSNLKSTINIVTAKDLGLELVEKISPVAYSVWIKVLLQNWRQGTVGCKGRSDVSKTNKKPWKQKGTGRARAGSARSPLWRGGGVIFGPQKRTRKLKLSKELKSSILSSLFLDMTVNQKVVTLGWAPSEAPSTKLASVALKDSGLFNKKIVLAVGALDFTTQASFSNLPQVRMVSFDEINAYEASMGEMFVCLEKDLDVLKGAVSRWL